MIEFNPAKKVLKICIPASGLDDARRYHNSILKILEKIEIDHCEPGIREDLNNIYELLSHLLAGDEFLSFGIRASSDTTSRLSV